MGKLQEGKLKNGDDASRLLQVGTYAAARVAALEALEKRLGGNLANATSGAHEDKHDSEETKAARLWRSDKAEQETTTKDPAAAAAAAAEKLERKAATNIWQRPLARHMQRRTRSHQSRKMPVKRRLKRQHADVEELDTRKARRGRREFFRNEPHTVSHLWAVKRLHMGEPFGFSGRPVALRSQEHGLRFALDASKHGCMVHDCSYLRWARVPFETSQAWVPKGEARLGFHDYASKSLEFHDGTKGPAMLYPGNQGKGYLLVAHRPDASLPLDHFEDASMSLTLFRLRGDRSHEVLGAALGPSLAEASGATRDTWRALFGPQRTIHAPRHMPPGVMIQLRVHNANVLALKLGGKSCMEPDASSIVQDPATIAKKLAKEGMSLESGIEADTISEQETLLTLVRHHDNSWDLVIASPRASGVARNLWVLLVHAGASAAGWEEERAATLASGRPLFPDDFPETEAFSKYWKAQEATHVAVNMKRPRGKRIASPYDVLVQHEYGRDDQAFCTIELRLRQPQGCRARVDVGAKVFMVREDEYEAVVKKGQTADVDMSRDPVGFVTSALGRTRVRASSLVSSPGRASGRGFIQLAKLAKDRENFVLVQNPGTEALALGRVTCVREKC